MVPPTSPVLGTSLAPAQGSDRTGGVEPIAVVGAGCRFPGGVTDLESLGRVLSEGPDLLRPVPADRWGREVADRGDSVNHVGAFLEDVDRFDAAFFGVPPQEAALMDPQQRLLLEVAWEAMSDSGRPREAWRGSRTAVFVGMLADDYHLLHARAFGASGIGPHHVSGLESSFAAGRLAYTFDLHGPAVAVHAACSSSLLAVHQASRSLRSGETDTALAGGTSLLLSPDITVFLSRVGAVSASGRCRPFDAAADGLVRGEGCGVVVLKRLRDALAGGDRIHAVISGSAAVHDGSSLGLTAPNPLAQAGMLRAALADAGLEPGEVDFVEAHGTGTALGDQVELGVLSEVYGRGRDAGRRLLVGALKAVLGHADAAAGIAGFLKAVWVVEHGRVPAQPRLERLTPALDWSTSGIAVPLVDTPLTGLDRPARAAVSAFGLSGTNAHVIVEAAPQDDAPRGAAARDGEAPESSQAYVLLVSATSREALTESIARFRPEVESTDRLADLVASAATRSTAAAHRYAAVGTDCEALLAALRGDADEPADGAYAGVVADPDDPTEPVFVYAGQGGQWPGMAMDLYRADPAVREVLNECDELIRAEAGWSLLAELRAGWDGLDDAGRGAVDRTFNRTDLAQPAIFAVHVALTRWLADRGVRPAAVIGHSLGEVAAAHAAGCLSTADAMRVVVHRSRLLHETSGAGAMYAVQGDPQALADLTGGSVALPDGMGVAAVNGPGDVVLGGAADTVIEAARELEARGLRCRRLRVAAASHSPLAAALGPRLVAALSGLTPSAPRIRLLSSADPGADLTLPDAQYWGRNLAQPVRLWPAIDRLLARGDHPLVELGPHPVLGAPLADAVHRRGRTGPVIGTLRRDQPGRSALARTLAQLYCAGAVIDWERVTGRPRRFHTLPLPVWRGDRYWLPGVPRGVQPAGSLEAGAASATLPAQIRVSLLDAAGNVTAEMVAAPAGTTPAVPVTTPAATPAPQVSAPAPAAPVVPSVVAPGGSDAPIADRVEAAVREVLGLSTGRRLMRQRGLFEQGLDSLTAARLRARLESEFVVSLAATAVFENPNILALAAHLEQLGARATTASDVVPSRVAPSGVAPSGVAGTKAAGAEPIAIVGISCRLPGADSPEEFWRLLSEGRSEVSDPPPGRRANPVWAEAGNQIPQRSCYLDDVTGFDAAFFRISPREARSLDPQQRLMLEVSWDALEDAGLRPRTLGGRPVGVYVGLEAADYQQLITRDMANVDLYYGTGTSFAAVSGRLSYVLGLTGPSIVVDTACSASLTAVHLACQGLRAGDCEVAVVGGANVMIAPTLLLAMADSGALAADGRCRTFDEAADGYGCGEGAVALVLKPLSAAERDGDRVYAVIRGSAVNQDGASGGFTVPNAAAQTTLIRRALDSAGWAPGDVDYLEAHGTGTPLGDPIEVNALAAAYSPGRDPERPLLIGSVKPNVGHLAAAAGVTGLLKVVLSLRHRQIPRHLLERPSSRIAWDRLPVAVATEHRDWPQRGRPARAGVSSFGLTGTNTHVLVEEPPAAPSPEPALPGSRGTSGYVLPVSAATPTALRAAAGRLAAQIRATPERIDDIVQTAVYRRSWLEHRLVVTGDAAAAVAEALAQVAAGQDPPSVRFGHVDPEEAAEPAGGDLTVERFLTGPEPAREPEQQPGTGGGRPVSVPGYPWEHRSYWFREDDGPASERVVFVYPGQGGQWPGMGARLLDTHPVFATAMAECDKALFPHTRWHVVDVVRQVPGALGLDRVDVVQPALWAVMVSLTRLWESVGVRPSAVVGHSQGEIAAAHVAGALSLADAAAVVALRSRAITALAGTGAMASLATTPDRARELIADRLGVAVAAVNSPISVVVSGVPDAVHALLDRAGSLGIRTRLLPVGYASHSPYIEQLHHRLHDALRQITPAPATIPFYSALTGSRLDTSRLTGEYWYENLRRPVRFDLATGALLADGLRTFLEPTPHPTLSPAIIETAEAETAKVTTVTTLRRDSDELPAFLTAAERAADGGEPVPWHVVFPGRDIAQAAPRGPAPERSAEEDAFWAAVAGADADALAATLDLDAEQRAALTAVLPALTAWRCRAGITDWRYRVTWEPVELRDGACTGTWLLAVPARTADHPWIAACMQALTRGGGNVHRCVVASDASADAIIAQLGRHPGVTTVVSLLALDTAAHPQHPLVPAGLAGTTALAQALARTRPQARLWALTTGAVSTDVGELVADPLQAAVHGLLRVVGLDTPGLWGGVVDIPPAPDAALEELLLSALVNERYEDQLAVRPGGLLARRLIRAALPGTPARRWRPHGTVLVTGGTGAIGIHLAHWLAARGADHLLLLNRSGPDTPTTRALVSALASGHPRTGVTIAACDLTDPEDVERALRSVPGGAPLTAVFHTAAVVGRREPLERLDLSDFDEVLAAKAVGPRTLDQVLADTPLEAFVLFSSNAGVWGSSGQGPYAAANAYLDALAAERRGRGLAGTSVAWGAWAGEGGSAGAEAADFLNRRGLRPMDPQSALAALGQVLDYDETLVSIADVDWARFAETYTMARPRPLIGALAWRDQAQQGGGSGPAGRPALVERLAALPPAQWDWTLVEAVRAEVAAVLGHDGTRDVLPDRPLRALGMDSVVGVELRNRLSAATGLQLPAALVFDYPTPVAVADLLRARLGERAGVPLTLTDGAVPRGGDLAAAGDGTADAAALDVAAVDSEAVLASIDSMDLDDLLKLARKGGA